MKSVFLVHSLRKGGAERLLLELASNINCSSITIISWLDNNEFLEEEYQNVKVVSLIKKNEYRWLLSLFSSSRKLKSYLNLIAPDNVIIFSHSVFWLAYLANYKTKYAYSVQGFSQLSESRGYKKYIYRFIDIITLRRLKSAIVVPTQELYNEAKKYFVANNNQLEIIPNGVDVFAIKPKSLKRDEIVITMLGTLSIHKGHHLTIDIIKKLKKKVSNIKLNIIGEGSIKDELASKIDENNLDRNIFLLGRRDDAFNLMNESDIFLHLSLSEGMPLAVIEAMMCSLPIVAFDVSGLRDVVGNNGFLCDYGDTDSIATRVYELISDKNLRDLMSVRSREIALNSFSKQKMILSYDAYLQRLIESNN